MEQKEIYIETERIIIRNFKQKDAEGLLEYLSNPRVNCFAGDRLCSEEAAWAYMQYSPKVYRNRTNYHSKFQAEGCRRVVGVSFHPRVNCFAGDRLCSERGGMGIYAVFPERHAALCGESEKR